MLNELRIKNLGVIEEAVIAPHAGFTVVTGETGAGKTMIVNGLSLLTGEKADPKLIRSGTSRALVEAEWIQPGTALEPLEEFGAEVEPLSEGTAAVLITRQLEASRSKLLIGGATIPLNQGVGLIGDWVTIHGQSEQVRLARPQRQRQMLDAWAGADLDDLLARYQQAYFEKRDLDAELLELTKQSATRLHELDMLRYGLADIAKVDPQPGEDQQLALEAKRLQSVDELQVAARAAAVALSGDVDSFADAGNALNLIEGARKALGKVDDPVLLELSARLGEASVGLTDISMALASYLDSLEADPIRLEWIASRRSELQQLTRKYGDNIDAVLAWADSAMQRVFELDSSDDRAAQIKERIAALDATANELAAQISKVRQTCGAQLAELVGTELAVLAMPAARLEFELTQLPQLNPWGRDQVQIMFAANSGSELGALAKFASGGELSRVRLALEVVLASRNDHESSYEQVFVFDEIDAGVGGAVALEIGRRLKRLAQSAQVIVVTHLAQVAAFADRHFFVSKADDQQVTKSQVNEVTGADRLDVLAQMMGGLDSASAIAHAQDLLQTALSG
ncbi:MAG: DNA repair protein RecN [Propionibacteriaceae bacterium]|nr:DNA repair protein RecN [Propionibacteriaceae bacterium]